MSRTKGMKEENEMGEDIDKKKTVKSGSLVYNEQLECEDS